MVAASKMSCKMSLSKMLLKNGFLSETSKFCIGPYNSVQILPVCGPSRYQIRERDLRISMSAVAMVARKSFNRKFTAKIGF